MWRPLSLRASGAACTKIPASPFSRSLCAGAEDALSLSTTGISLAGESDIVMVYKVGQFEFFFGKMVDEQQATG
jgi:hypothetical protein